MSDNTIESISLEIAKYWGTDKFLSGESFGARGKEWGGNENCGTFVAFDWREDDDEEYYLTDVNTNIDLGEVELEHFEFDKFLTFLNTNGFTNVLGIRVKGSEIRRGWYDMFLKSLKMNENLGWKEYYPEIEYDEYILEHWTSPLPSFGISDKTFILRFSYDSHNGIDQMASTQGYFETFVRNSDWNQHYKINPPYIQINGLQTAKKRVIVFCSTVETLLVTDGFDK